MVNSASSAAFSCSNAAAAAASVSSSTLRIAACISSADRPPPDVAAVAVAAAVLGAPLCQHKRQLHEAYAVNVWGSCFVHSLCLSHIALHIPRTSCSIRQTKQFVV